MGCAAFSAAGVASTTGVAGGVAVTSGVGASAGNPEYWIVNLRDDVVDVLRDPDPTAGRYRATERIGRGSRVALAAFPDAIVAVDDLLPAR